MNTESRNSNQVAAIRKNQKFCLMNKKIYDALLNFQQVCREIGIEFSAKRTQVETLCAPHGEPELPPNKIAVYIFFHAEDCLKVGMVGPKSKARYRYHHYRFKSSKSNLAAKLCSDSRYGRIVNEQNVGDWIKNNTCRINILLDTSKTTQVEDYRLLRFLEAYLICILVPIFEGKINGEFKKLNTYVI